ncbi:outer membrane protein TolC [Desulfitispora alkaliphila]|uniref:TolC family protein n=1 Tax=Desulfitispora alkaliphila TaxID=622674 RepID=UPI003D2335F2
MKKLRGKATAKIGALLLAAVLLTGTVFAQTGEAEGETQVLPLTLKEAQEISLENHPRMELAEVGVEKARMGVRQAKSAKDSLADAERKDYSMVLQERTVVPMAESGLKIAEHSYKIQEQGLKLEVERAYYDYLAAEEQLKNEKQHLERAEKQLRHAKASFEAGMVAKNDVLGAETQVAQARAGLMTAEDEVEKARMEFAKTLGMSLDSQFELVDRFQFERWETDIQAAVEAAKEKSTEVLMARENLKNKKLEFDVATSYWTPNVFTYREAEYSYKEAKIELEDLLADVEVNIRSSYMGINTLAEQYQVLTKAKEHTAESLRLAQLRYEAGMATSADVLSAQIELNEMEKQVTDVLYNYNTAVAGFKLETGLEL